MLSRNPKDQGVEINGLKSRDAISWIQLNKMEITREAESRGFWTVSKSLFDEAGSLIVKDMHKIRRTCIKLDWKTV